MSIFGGSKSYSTTEQFDQKQTANMQAGRDNYGSVYNVKGGGAGVNINSDGSAAAIADATYKSVGSLADAAKHLAGQINPIAQTSAHTLIETQREQQKTLQDFGHHIKNTAADALKLSDKITDKTLDFSADLTDRNLDTVDKNNAGLFKTLNNVVNKASDITSLSMANMAAIKSGETIAKPTNRNLAELGKVSIAVTVVLSIAYVLPKLKGKK